MVALDKLKSQCTIKEVAPPPKKKPKLFPEELSGSAQLTSADEGGWVSRFSVIE
jgi:hypothetical protein